MAATQVQTKSLIRRFIEFLQGVSEEDEQEQEAERALSFSDIYSHVWALLMESAEHPYAWINDLYDDGEGNTFAIVSSGGKLYRTPVLITSNTVSLGEFVEVVIEFVPRARMQIHRSKGRVRATIIAGSAVLNRGGEIDSRDLFDSFIKHIERTGEYPDYGFYHLWDDDGGFGELRLGVVDWVGREGNLYLASVLFDDTELARAAVAAIEKGPDFWGNSIGFKYFSEIDRELMDVGGGITIPVYKRGRNHEISLLPEGDAAAWFTSVAIAQERAMNERERAALLKIFEDDPEKAEKFLEEARSVDRTIQEAGLVTRQKQGEEAPAPQEEEGSGGDTEADDEGPIIEVDEELLAQIAEQATQTPAFLGVVEGLTSLREEFDTLRSQFEKELLAERQKVAQAEQRLASLERDDSEKQREWQADAPRSRARVSYRPRDARRELDELPNPASDEKHIVETSLSKVPKY